MPRSIYGPAVAMGVLLAVAHPSSAQTTTYHFHKEASSTSGLTQLKTAGPDAARFAIVSADMKNQAAGPRTIATLDTQAGVPNLGGVLPSGASITFTVWMKKSSNNGTVFPQASLGLNVPVSPTLCQATGTTAVTTTLASYTLSCTLSSAIVMKTTDRLTVAGGFNMTVGPGTKSMTVELDVEGTLNGSGDSRVVAPNPLPPAITSLTPGSGRVGASITIAGSNFGATQGTSAVKFFNNVTASVASWANTSITAAVPADVATGNVTVTVGGAVSNGAAFTVIPPPTITSVTPSSAHVGETVTIAGSSFNATQGTSTVTFNGTAAAPASWSDTSITVPVPAGATSGPVVVTVAGAASNGAGFTVIPAPSITTLTPSSGRVGNSITIAGANFGTTQGSSTVKFNGTAATPSSWSAASIGVPVPAGATTGPVVVTVAGAASNGVSFTVIPPPSITTLTPASGGSGTAVTIAGANFGATQGTSTIAFNGVGAAATAWSDTSISTAVPAGATTGPVVVTVAGQASNGSVFTVQAGPTITSLSPASGHVTTEVTIAGTGLGATQGSSTVTFNGTLAYAVESWSDTSVVVDVPAGATTGPVVVTVAAQASNGSPFTVDNGTGTGLIEFVSPADGAVVNPGQQVTINLSSPDNSTFLGLVVVGDDPLGESDELETLPAQVPMTIPAQIGLGRYAVSAFAVTTAGDLVVETIEVDVERSDQPYGIVPRIRQFDFGAEGETGRIELIGFFADGTSLPVEESSNVTYASTNPLVATVDADAIVTASGEGNATITATYGDPANGIIAKIPVRVPRPFLGVAPRPVAFADQGIGTTASQNVTITNNDHEPLSVLNVAVAGDYAVTDTCVAASPLPTGGSCTVTVSFTPTAAGARAGAIAIRTSLRSLPVSVTLTGTGIGQ